VMNKHREVIYEERQKVLEGADIKSIILDMVEQELRELLEASLQDGGDEDWDLEVLLRELAAILPPSSKLTVETLEQMGREECIDHVIEVAREQYDARELQNGADVMRLLERIVMLTTIDRLWVEHLTAMDDMREGIGLHAYGQVDPLVAYKREAFDMFEQLMANIRNGVARGIYHVQLAPQTVAVPVAAPPASLRENRDAIEANTGAIPLPDGAPVRAPVAAAAGGGVAVMHKVGRNDPCPCGSGKKFKRCHGAS
jgi:preprotein translocase subunit SecA